MRTTCVPRLFVISVLLILSSNVYAQGPSAEELLIQAIKAERKNRDIMVNYLFREAVHVHYQCGPKTKMRDQSKVFDVIILEGQPYFELVEEDGAPLSDKKKKQQEEMMRKVADERRVRRMQGGPPKTQSGRTAFRYEHLAEFHDARLGGEEELNGRRSIVLETKPKVGISGSDKEELILANSTTKIWLDTETFLPLKSEVRMLEKVGNWPTGMVLQGDSQPLDQGWMPRRLYQYRPLTGVAARLLNCSAVEVEQLLSKFRKFESESKFYPGDVVPEH